MGIQTVERVGCTRQRRNKAEVVRIVQVALAFADSRRQLRRLLSHIDAGVKALRRLLPLGCDGVNLRCTLAVVDEQVDFDTGALGRFAVLSSLDDHALLILPQTGVCIDKTEDRLPACFLEQLEAQRCAELTLRLLAEPLDELNVMVCQGFIEHPRPVLLRVAQLVKQDGAQRSDLAAGGDFAGQHQTGVLLQPVFALRCRCFLCLALHAFDKTFSRLSGVCFGCRTAHLLWFHLLLRSDGRTRAIPLPDVPPYPCPYTRYGWTEWQYRPSQRKNKKSRQHHLWQSVGSGLVGLWLSLLLLVAVVQIGHRFPHFPVRALRHLRCPRPGAFAKSLAVDHRAGQRTDRAFSHQPIRLPEAVRCHSVRAFISPLDSGSRSHSVLMTVV